MHLQYLCLFNCHVDVDVCIYSTCFFKNCHVDVDVDNVQRGEHVVKTLRGIAI